jgi:cell division protein FtsW
MGNERILKIDWSVCAFSLLLLGFGIVFVYSSSFAVAQQRFGGADFFLGRQVIRALLGLACLVFFVNLDYHILGRMGNLAYVAAIGLLVFVLTLPDSHAVNGAKRWVNLGVFSIQASDFARIALILMLAKRIDRAGDAIRDLRVLGELMAKIGIVCVLVVLEPDFSTAALIAAVGIAMLYAAGARFIHMAAFGAALLPLAILGVTSASYRLQRLMGFLHMSSHKNDLGYQAYQALIGLGHGGLVGVGLGEGNQKLFYVPEPHTDFVFSILGEEIGFLGLIGILLVFAFIVYRCVRIAINAPDRMGQSMAFGLTLALGLYVLVHAFVNTGLAPTTGVPLPFLSYGGMSLVFTMSSIGILLNISSQTDGETASRPASQPGRRRGARKARRRP